MKQVPEMTEHVHGLHRLEWRLKYAMVANVALVTVALTLAGSAFYRSWIRPPYAPGGNLQVGQLALVDKSGRTRALLLVADDGSASLRLSDSKGQPRATFGVGGDGEPALGLADRDGQLRAAVAVDASGAGSIGFFDHRQRLRARLGLGQEDDPALDFMDDAQRVRALLSIERNESLLRIADQEGRTRIGLGLSLGVPGIIVFDKDGEVVTRIPSSNPSPEPGRSLEGDR